MLDRLNLPSSVAKFLTPTAQHGGDASTPSSALDSMRSIEAKTARLTAAKERARTLKKHGAAASVLLELALDRSCTMSRALERWRSSSSYAKQQKQQRKQQKQQQERQARQRGGSSTEQQFATAEGAAELQQKLLASQAEAAKLREENARLRAVAEGRGQSEARAAAELKLLRKELDDEWGSRLDETQRDAQQAMVRHLYEKQELRAAHHKAMQQASFDRMDMLAQQEARAKVREGQLYHHALEQVERLKKQLKERQESADDIIKRLHKEEEEGREEREEEGVKGNKKGGASDSGEGDENAVPQSSPSRRARGGFGADASPGAYPPTRAPPPSQRTPQQGQQPQDGAEAEAAKEAAAEALREQQRLVEGKLAEARKTHQREIAQCDEQSAKLRAALGSMESRLSSTEGQLKAASEAAAKAEGQRARALLEKAEGARMVSELQKMLDDANARLHRAGGALTDRSLPMFTPRDAPDTALSAASQQASTGFPLRLPGGGSASASSSSGALSSHPHLASLAAAASSASARSHPAVPLLPLGAPAGGMESARSLGGASLAEEEAYEEEALLSQRALEFLAELPGTAPPTPMLPASPASGASASRPASTTPSSVSPPLGGLSQPMKFEAHVSTATATPGRGASGVDSELQSWRGSPSKSKGPRTNRYTSQKL